MDDVITIFMHAQQDSPEAMKEILAKFNPLIQKECKYEYGLNKDSVILLEQIRTIDKKRLREKIDFPISDTQAECLK